MAIAMNVPDMCKLVEEVVDSEAPNG